MAVYISRNVDLAAASAWAQMTACAGETRNDVIVPPGMHSIKSIWLVPGSCTFTTAVGCILAFRIRGLGFEYETVAGGETGGVITGAAGGGNGFNKTTIINTNILVEPGQALTLEGCQVTAGDAGAPFIAVTLGFDSGQGQRRWSFARYTVAAGTLDGKTTCNINAVGTTVNHIQLPGNVSKITHITAAIGGATLATATGGNMLARLEGAMAEGDVCINIGSHGALNTTTAQNAFVYDALALPTDIKIDPTGMLWVYVTQTGVDWGIPDAGIAVEVM